MGRAQRRVDDDRCVIAPQYQFFAHALVDVGWGLDASLVGSASLMLAGIASFFVAPTAERVTVTVDTNTSNVPAGW